MTRFGKELGQAYIAGDMKKLRKTLKAVAAIIKNPWLLNRVLTEDSIWSDYIDRTYKMKHGLPVVDINEVCGNLDVTLDYFAFLDGGSLPTDIALLKSLSKQIKNCQYFEIGTWRGESVVNVAEHAADCYTLNLSKADLLAIGAPERYADLHGFFSKSKSNITHLEGNSLNYDFKGLNKKFDLIFIDGDHHYDFVKNDTAKVFEHLVHDDTVVVWHDYAFSPEKIRPEVMAGILDAVPAECRKHLYHVSNSMCAIYCKREFKTSVLSSPIVPDKTFRVRVESREI